MYLDYEVKIPNSRHGITQKTIRKHWGSDPIKDTPFVVINADDYYGKEGFKKVHEYLVNGGTSCMAGFVLKNTLSDNCGVTHGICKIGPMSRFSTS